MITRYKDAILLFDIHMPFENKELLELSKEVIKDKQPTEIILGGDIVDNTKMSKFLNYEDKDITLKEELDLLNNFIEKLRELSPKSKIVLLQCNHLYERFNRYMLEHPELEGLVDLNINADEIVEYNKPYFPFNQKKIATMHGFKNNIYYTSSYTREYTFDMIIGHRHTFQRFSDRNGLNAYGIGCMCKLDMGYLRNRPTDWRNGFAYLKYFEEIEEYFIDFIEYKGGYIMVEDKIYK